MEIDFKDKKLRQLCEQQRLGRDSAHKLQIRLADMQAVDVVTDLVAGKPHPLKDEPGNQFSLRLAGGHRLVFEANHQALLY